MRKLKPIMFAGTASGVGKSTIAAGFCRIFFQDGFQPAPFKAQNMSLNSFATPEGLEIGRAQAVQAEACGIPCSADMNPLLLKPSGDQGCQIVLHGKPVGTQSAKAYFDPNNREGLFREVTKAYDRLAAAYNPIVMEGAGSIAELNLKHLDIVNMRMAIYAGADVYLVADIDRGGIFASVYGTIALLEEHEKKHIKGIIVNKFQGDATLFDEGKKKLEELCGIPVTGIVPYLSDFPIDEEDTVSLPGRHSRFREGKVNIAVVLLKRLSNYTDFKVLENDVRVHLFYTRDPDEIGKADIVILPGSKNTIADLVDIKNNGVARAVTEAYRNNKTVIGICGGYQMMGRMVCDPCHMEGDVEAMPGLGLLPVTTAITDSKITGQCNFYYKDRAALCSGYEIHMGITSAEENDQHLNRLTCGRPDGYMLNDRCWGTYVHGILDNSVVIEDLLGSVSPLEKAVPFDHVAFKEKQYDRLADHLRAHLDVHYIYRHLSASC